MRLGIKGRAGLGRKYWWMIIDKDSGKILAKCKTLVIAQDTLERMKWENAGFTEY